MINTKVYELKFNCWRIRYDNKDYSASAHWYAKDWTKEEPLSFEHKHNRFDTFEEALAWCREQESL